MKQPSQRYIAWGSAILIALASIGALCSAADHPEAEHTGFETFSWAEIGARAGADYKGDGLALTETESGAHLHCIFQRLEAEATSEGLWLRSTASAASAERFRVMAAAVGRPSGSWLTLSSTGAVSVGEKMVSFARAGLVEEYRVTMDGVRQDFVIRDRPVGTGELAVQLEVAGARVEPAAHGATFLLEDSGRQIAYSRLHVTDASGRERPARIEVGEAKSMVVLVDDANAVYPVRIDPTFSDVNWVSMGSLAGADGAVRAIVVNGASGTLYIGGDFKGVGPESFNHIAKWDENGWSRLGLGVNERVNALALSGSNLYAGGWFTMATNSNGVAVPVNGVAKWDGNTWSALGAPGSVYALAVSGSNVYAGGGNTIARWNGSSWSALASGFVGTVYALAVSDSELYAGGSFTAIGGQPAARIAKWDGNNWSAVGLGLDGDVHALTVSGNELYVGGAFLRATNYGGLGITVSRVARWDGSNWLALGEGMSSDVRALAVGTDGELYAGGEFLRATNSGGAPIIVNRTAKWNGSSWSALSSGVSGPVLALAVSDADDTLFAGGDFRTAGDSGAIRLAQWNGHWASVGAGLNNVVSAVAVVGDDIYAAGGFTSADGRPAHRIARWDGGNWSTVGGGMNDSINALAVQENVLYAAGAFTQVTNSGGTAVPAHYIAKWDGSNWSSLGLGVSSPVSALAVSGSVVYVGGGFTRATNSGGAAIVANRIAQWDGTNWSALGLGVDNVVAALAVSGSNLYAGGWFTRATNANSVAITVNRIARWDGGEWSALGAGLNQNVSALAVSGTTVYAGGLFTAATNAGGFTVPVRYIAEWKDAGWAAVGLGVNSHVSSLAISGNDLYVGGSFTRATNSGGIAIPAEHIAKWDGTQWLPVGPGLNGSVLALAVSGNTIYAGGHFTSAGGVPASRIAEWDGDSWSALVARTGLNGPVYALAVSGTNVYAGGQFTMAGDRVLNRVAFWDGSRWSPLGLGLNNEVYALAVWDTNLYVGGAFTTATNRNGVAVRVNRIARWDGSNWSALGLGFSSDVNALTVSGNNLYVGGAFLNATNSAGTALPVNRIAKWDGSSWSALASGLSGSVNALTAAGSDLYVGGSFLRATNDGGVAITVNRVAKWDGSAWSALGSGFNNGVVYALAVYDGILHAGGDFEHDFFRNLAGYHGGAWFNWYLVQPNLPVRALAVSGDRLLAGGNFTFYGSLDSSHIVQIRAVEMTLGSGMSGPVRALAVSEDGIYAGGLFTRAGTKPSAYVAKAVWNLAPTNITLSMSSVPENQPAGTLVGRFTAVDPDLDDQHTFALVSGPGDTDNSSFAIVFGTNLVTLASFDYESKSSYNIRVRTTDAGGLYFERTFTITVTDVNEAPLANAGGAYTLEWGNTLQLNGSGSFDPDAGDVLTYSWDLNNNGNFGDATGVNPSVPSSALKSLGLSTGLNTIWLRVTDSGGLKTTNATTVQLTCPVVTIAPETLPDAVVGAAYLQTNTASGGTPPYSFQVTAGALPPGLTLTTNTGVISGTPSATGTFTFTIQTRDTYLCAASRGYSLAVLPDLVITSAPAHHIVSLTGGSALLSVAASGSGTVVYQWRHNGVPIPGATASTLVLSNILPAQVGLYSAVVSNSSGAVTSPAAAVSLFGIERGESGSVHLKLVGISNAAYRIEYQPILESTGWLTLSNLTLLTNPFEVNDLMGTTATQRFYRAKYLP